MLVNQYNVFFLSLLMSLSFAGHAMEYRGRLISSGTFSEVREASPMRWTQDSSSFSCEAIRKYTKHLEDEEFSHERDLTIEATILHTIKQELMSDHAMHHRHIPKIDVTASTQDYIKMEKAVGAKLRDVAMQFMPIDFLNLMKNIMEVVAAIHSVGYAHEDLNSDNIIVDISDITKFSIVDFGMAGLIGKEMRRHPAHPSIAAPEMKLLGVIDAKADVYALGRIISAYFAINFPCDSSWRICEELTILMELMVRSDVQERIELKDAIVLIDAIIADKENQLVSLALKPSPCVATFPIVFDPNWSPGTSGYGNVK